jgi:hypothetical protein
MQEEAIISYSASKMILAVHSNVGYCNEKKSQSRMGGHIFLTNNKEHPTNNGAILIIATIIKAVMTSAAKEELGRSTVPKCTRSHIPYQNGPSATSNPDPN